MTEENRGDAQSPDPDWPRNYFNYFTEIEEHFQRVRGTALFLLSPLDWALIENWKNAGIPLEAVLRGVDEAFEKWRSRKVKRRAINSLAYCTQAVIEQAERTPASSQTPSSSDAPFTAGEIRQHLQRAAAQIVLKPEAPFQEVATSLLALEPLIENEMGNLENLERRFTALEEKLVAALRSMQSTESLYALREDLDRDLRPYRGKMTADQLAMLERRYLDTALLERAKLPRLSLFYLH
jgi:hypothetical protein